MIKQNIFRIAFMLLAIVAMGQQTTQATAAYPGVIEVQQPDGTMLRIRLFGDEYFNYTTTEDGATIAQDANGFYCYAQWTTNGVTISNTRVSSVSGFGSGLGRSKGVDPMVINVLRERQMQKRSMPNGNLNSAYAGGTRVPFEKVLVLLVDFSDVKFTTPSPEASFTNMLNQEGYSLNGGTGSARDYFLANSMGKYRPTIEVVQKVSLPQTMSFYGANDASGNDRNPRQMVIDACKIASETGLRLSDYDTDGDGEVDNVFIYYAGHNEAEGGPDNSIWPHRWSVIGMPGSAIDGVRLAYYACTSELRGRSGGTMAGIGSFCHEFGHVLGLCDLYDTDGTFNGNAITMGNLAIMDAGNYNNNGSTPPFHTAIERELMGWLQPEELTQPGEYTLSSIDKNKAYKISTKNPGEYFLIETRSDKLWDKYINGVGMLVYHIDKSNNMVGGRTAISTWGLNANNPNSSATHQCADLVEASGVEDRKQNSGNRFFPGKLGVTELSSFSRPAIIKPWNSISLDAGMSDITRNSDGSISFRLSFEKVGQIYGAFKDPETLKGIPSATVILRRDLKQGEKEPENMQYVTMTDKIGGFSILNAALGTYTIIVQCDGYATFTESNIEITETKVTLAKNLVKSNDKSPVIITTYQRDMRIDWNGLKTRTAGATTLQWREIGASSYLSKDVGASGQNIYQISNLEPKKAYEIVILDESKNELYRRIGVTLARTSNYAAIAQTKGEYTAGDTFDFVLANHPKDMKSVEWLINDAPVNIETNPTSLTLAAGKTTVVANITLASDDIETITKVFNIK